MSIFHSAEQLIVQRDVLGCVWLVARERLCADQPALGMKEIMSWHLG